MTKGSRREREAVDLYQQAGFATYRPATVRYGENDMFGLFDLLAVSPSHRRVHGVQVKSNKTRNLTRWKRLTSLWRRLGWFCGLLVCHDSRGWVMYDTNIDPDDGRRVCRVAVDERDADCKMGHGVVEWLNGRKELNA